MTLRAADAADGAASRPRTAAVFVALVAVLVAAFVLSMALGRFDLVEAVLSGSVEART